MVVLLEIGDGMNPIEPDDFIDPTLAADTSQNPGMAPGDIFIGDMKRFLIAA